MLRSIKELEGYTIRATDGDIGQVNDFFFEDDKWVVRYLVVETGHWLASRKVLISPIAFGTPDRAKSVLPVSITREQVKSSPDIDTDKPVSRQQEMRYHGYYGYPNYWGGAGIWGMGAYPGMMLAGGGYGGTNAGYLGDQAAQDRMTREAALPQHDDPRLRSGNAIMKYHIEASDGNIGHVEGLLLDEDTWAIRYFIVDTSNWWVGHTVLISPQWIKGVNWSERTVSINLTREAIRMSPPYDPAHSLQRPQEAKLHDHYQRAGYWADHVELQNPEFRPVEAAPQDVKNRHV